MTYSELSDETRETARDDVRKKLFDTDWWAVGACDEVIHNVRELTGIKVTDENIVFDVHRGDNVRIIYDPGTLVTSTLLAAADVDPDALFSAQVMPIVKRHGMDVVDVRELVRDNLLDQTIETLDGGGYALKEHGYLDTALFDEADDPEAAEAELVNALDNLLADAKARVIDVLGDLERDAGRIIGDEYAFMSDDEQIEALIADKDYDFDEGGHLL